MNTFPADKIQSLAIDTWDGPEQLVNIFAANAGVTYPILMNGGLAGILTDYACNYDYFFVIGGDGLIKWRGDWIIDPGVEAAITSAVAELTPSPVPDLPTGGHRLQPNYPNPFNPLTRIPYDLAGEVSSATVRLEILDLRGRVVKTLVDERQATGQRYEVTWNGTNTRGRSVPSGTYVSRLVVDGVAQSRVMTLIK